MVCHYAKWMGSVVYQRCGIESHWGKIKSCWAKILTETLLGWMFIWYCWQHFSLYSTRCSKMNSELMPTYDTTAYMSNVHKNHLSRQTGSRYMTGPQTLPTIWHNYMKLVTKYQISPINSCWEKCDEKYLGRTEGRTDGRTDRRKDGRTEGRTDGRTDIGKTVYPLLWSGVIKIRYLL